jgi:hypothetical protein
MLQVPVRKNSCQKSLLAPTSVIPGFSKNHLLSLVQATALQSIIISHQPEQAAYTCRKTIHHQMHVLHICNQLTDKKLTLQQPKP